MYGTHPAVMILHPEIHNEEAECFCYIQLLTAISISKGNTNKGFKQKEKY